MKYDGDAFYKTARWKRLRAAVLRRDGYMCQWSKRYGKHVEADHVHHVFPRELFPEYQWCAWNLVSLSRTEHNEMHDRVTNDLTDKGMTLLRSVARRNNIDVPWRYQEGAR